MGQCFSSTIWSARVSRKVITTHQCLQRSWQLLEELGHGYVSTQSVCHALRVLPPWRGMPREFIYACHQVLMGRSRAQRRVPRGIRKQAPVH